MTPDADPAPAPPPRISVAIGTHNGARFLEPQLRSILEQSVPVDELVVSDDASTDRTVELVQSVVDEYRGEARTLDLVLIRNPEPLGVTANFEQALAAATGELVALSDQDDVWHPRRVQRAVEQFARQPATQIVASQARLVDAAGQPTGADLFSTLGIDDAMIDRIDRGHAFPELLKRNVLTGATMMLRRGLIERSAPFPRSWVHDEWLAIVASVTGGIAIVREPLIDYRQHGANQIGVTTLGWRGKVGRLQTPRTERNARLRIRAEDLRARLPELVPDAAVARETEDKLAHEVVRSELPAARVRRIRPVVREWRTGRYRRYGLGAQDVLRDLVQRI